MRAILTLLLVTAFSLPTFASAGGGAPGGDPCLDRQHGCTTVEAGSMSCLPAAGTANSLSAVVGSADSGTFNLVATGVTKASEQSCLYEVRVDAANVQFNEGWTVGLLAPYGGVTSTSSTPCSAAPGQTCVASATFTWWRAQHGVTFDIPYELYVNGMLVAKGKCHYYDPPAWDALVGPTVLLA